MTLHKFHSFERVSSTETAVVINCLRLQVNEKLLFFSSTFEVITYLKLLPLAFVSENAKFPRIFLKITQKTNVYDLKYGILSRLELKRSLKMSKGCFRDWRNMSDLKSLTRVLLTSFIYFKCSQPDSCRRKFAHQPDDLIKTEHLGSSEYCSLCLLYLMQQIC